MNEYVVMHLHNAAPEQQSALSKALATTHADAVGRLRGFVRWQRFAIAKQQLMPGIAQPWQYLSVYEFNLLAPELHLPALATHLADLRDDGLIAQDGTERLYTYRMRSPWKYSDNHRHGQPLSHLMVLFANVTPGREAEYHDWYDRVHSVEVCLTPGYVGMKRGILCEVQVPPVHYCPGDQLIMGAIQSTDLTATLAEFVARATGASDSGIVWAERSTAASVARTVHMFESVEGPSGAPD